MDKKSPRSDPGVWALQVGACGRGEAMGRGALRHRSRSGYCLSRMWERREANQNATRSEFAAVFVQRQASGRACLGLVFCILLLTELRENTPLLIERQRTRTFMLLAPSVS